MYGVTYGVEKRKKQEFKKFALSTLRVEGPSSPAMAPADHFPSAPSALVLTKVYFGDAPLLRHPPTVATRACYVRGLDPCVRESLREGGRVGEREGRAPCMLGWTSVPLGE